MQVRHTIFAQQNSKNNSNLGQNNMRVLHKKFGVPGFRRQPRFLAAESVDLPGLSRCQGSADCSSKPINARWKRYQKKRKTSRRREGIYKKAMRGRNEIKLKEYRKKRDFGVSSEPSGDSNVEKAATRGSA
jgi:hypothetical protein